MKWFYNIKLEKRLHIHNCTEKRGKKGEESTRIRWQEEVKYNHDQREKFPGMVSRPSKCVKAKNPVHKWNTKTRWHRLVENKGAEKSIK